MSDRTDRLRCTHCINNTGPPEHEASFYFGFRNASYDARSATPPDLKAVQLTPADSLTFVDRGAPAF